jgi:RNA polymerase II-associated protein 1
LIQIEPTPALEDHLVSILVALVRHSPQSADAILNCPRLIESVTKLLTKQGSMDIHSSQIKGANLLKVTFEIPYSAKMRDDVLLNSHTGLFILMA